MISGKKNTPPYKGVFWLNKHSMLYKLILVSIIISKTMGAMHYEVDETHHPISTLPYEQDLWDNSKAYQIALEKLVACEKEKPDHVSLLEDVGLESFLVLIGTDYVVRVRKGVNLCEELDNVSLTVKTFSEKKVDFSQKGLFICLPVRSFFLKAVEANDGYDNYVNLFVLPKAKGKKLSDSLLRGVDYELMHKVFWQVGYGLGLFQHKFMKDHGTHISTAKHGDLSPWNIFYDIQESKPNIYWIDCTHMYIKNESPWTDLVYILRSLEGDLFKCVEVTKIKEFQKQILQGYSAVLSLDGMPPY
jgi:hypothetical protein